MAKPRLVQTYWSLVAGVFVASSASVSMALLSVPCSVYRVVETAFGMLAAGCALGLIVICLYRAYQRLRNRQYIGLLVDTLALVVPAGALALMIALTIDRTLFYCADFSGIDWCSTGLCVH
jgi:hypothetical protein